MTKIIVAIIGGIFAIISAWVSGLFSSPSVPKESVKQEVHIDQSKNTTIKNIEMNEVHIDQSKNTTIRNIEMNAEKITTVKNVNTLIID